MKISAFEYQLPARKLSVKEAAAILGMSKGWLDKKRVTGGGPPYLKLGRRVLYDPRDLEDWAAAARQTHTSGINSQDLGSRR